MTLTDALVSSCHIPCTPSELAASFNHPIRSVRSLLYQLQKQGRVRRLDRGVKSARRIEHFWMAE